MKHTINSKGRASGRVATEAVVFLMGKDRADFARNKVADVKVEIVSAGERRLWMQKSSTAKLMPTTLIFRRTKAS